MAKYVDGFVLKVPKEKAEEYKKMAEGGRDMWLKFGALGYYECRGDDLKQMDMEGKKSRSFTEMVGAENRDDVWFSFIIFRSKEHRDEVNAKVMKAMGEEMKEYKDMTMPFDMQDMAYGGFQVEVEGG
jgi:uncharacterized protein YbaA (DUF1428 family)